MKLRICESDGSVTISEFMKEIASVYNKYFPKSKCDVKFSTNFGSTIWIDCYLAGDKNEEPYGFWVNDMFGVSFSIELPDDTEKTSKVPDSITLTARSSFIKTKPSNKFLAFDAKKVPFRKITGSAEKILSGFDKYVQKLYNMVKTEYDNGNINDDKKSLVKDKLQ